MTPDKAVTMTIIYLLLMIFAAVAIVGIPVRLVQLIRGSIQSVYVQLNVIPRIVVTIGLAGLLVGAVSWLGVVYVAIMVFTDDLPLRLWGGSELGMTFSVFGFLYLVVELLLVPLTISQIRNERAVSA